MKIRTLTSVLLITLVITQFYPVQTQAAVSLAKPVKQTETVNAVSNGEISAIRYSKAADKVRVVFDLNDTTQYEVKPLDNGYIMVDFSEPISKNYAGGINIGDSSVPFVEIYSDGKMSCAVIQVTDGSAYESGELKGPRRLYVDISKDYEYSITKNLEPGLTQSTPSMFSSIGMCVCPEIRTSNPAGCFSGVYICPCVMNIVFPSAKITALSESTGNGRTI